MRISTVVPHSRASDQGALYAVGCQSCKGFGQQPGAKNPALTDGFLVGVSESATNGVPGQVYYGVTPITAAP